MLPYVTVAEVAAARVALFEALMAGVEKHRVDELLLEWHRLTRELDEQDAGAET